MLVKCINDIEGKDWVENIPTQEDSFVLRKSYELYTKKFDDFSPSDLRFIIGQQHYLDYTLPLAIKLLKVDLLIETDFYAGALLENVLNVNIDYWNSNLELKNEIIEIIEGNIHRIKTEITLPEIKDNIIMLCERFLTS